MVLKLGQIDAALQEMGGPLGIRRSGEMHVVVAELEMESASLHKELDAQQKKKNDRMVARGAAVGSRHAENDREKAALPVEKKRSKHS